MVNDLAHRLRTLRDQKNWTVADMAERTGIPKRTLDKYMLRSGASLPGFDALCALAKGLGVSLDWLIFGAESASEGVELFAERAAHDVVKMFMETLLRYQQEGEPNIVGNGIILRLSPEEWSDDLGWRVGQKARDLVREGLTLEDLLEWKRRRSERARELLHDRIAALTDRQPATD